MDRAKGVIQFPFMVEGLGDPFHAPVLIIDYRLLKTAHKSLFFVKFDYGQRETPLPLPHHDVHVVLDYWIVSAVGDVVVGGRAESEQGD